MMTNTVAGTCLIAFAASFASFSQVDNQEQAPPISQEALVTRLRHQEGLIRSVVCDFEVKKAGTPKDMIPLIKKLRQLQGLEHNFGKSVGGSEAAMESYAATVWRKGSKERQEKKYLDPNCKVPLDRVTAYDGQLVRQLFGDAKVAQGQIGTLQSTHLRSTGEFNLMGALYEIYGLTQSKIVSEAKEFSAERVSIGGKRHLRVLLRGFAKGMAGIALYFDERDLLVQRDIIAPKGVGGNEQDWVSSRHLLSDYRRYMDSSGETIWVPHTVVFRTSPGSLPDGTFIEFYRETATIKRIEFNVNIPDEKFTIEFPKNSRLRLLDDVPPAAIPAGTLPPKLPDKPSEGEEKVSGTYFDG